ncbi:MAG TPA: HutD family protein [Steroidobacteraceae bacterium]|nr:HutD family protein [Steroidobacteraceae bacterium]
MPAGASVQVLRAAERTAVPWKNGGGITREVAVSPPGSAIGNFDWRVSIAEIAVAGPFSLFPLIDRSMAVLDGRLSLSIDGQAPLTLSRESAAVSFAGEVPVFAQPLGSAVTDLNVMSRRGRCSATLGRRAADARTVLRSAEGTRLIVARSDLTVYSGEGAIALAPLDALICTNDPLSIEARGAGAALFDLIAIHFSA